jgi:hypothetical protein
MQGYTAEAYQFFVRRCLARIGDRAVDELKTLLRQSLGLQAESLEIIIRPKGILKEVPITLCFKNQFKQPGTDRTIALGDILGPVLTPTEEESAYRYDNNGVETLEIELQTLIEWFSTCWLAARGPELPLPAFLSIENDLEALDLKEMNWIPNPARTSKTNQLKRKIDHEQPHQLKYSEHSQKADHNRGH